MAINNKIENSFRHHALRQMRTEPCEWCDLKPIPLFYAECCRAKIDNESQIIDVKFCPNCGRKLSEGEEQQ